MYAGMLAVVWLERRSFMKRHAISIREVLHHARVRYVRSTTHCPGA